MKKFDLPGIAKGTVIPYSAQVKMLKEEQEKREAKKNIRKQFFHDILIAFISVLISNADRIFHFILKLLNPQ